MCILYKPLWSCNLVCVCTVQYSVHVHVPARVSLWTLNVCFIRLVNGEKHVFFFLESNSILNRQVIVRCVDVLILPEKTLKIIAPQ